MASAEDDDADGSMCSMKVVVNCVGDFGARIYRLELIRKVPVGPQNSAGVVLPPSDDVVFHPLSANKQTKSNTLFYRGHSTSQRIPSSLCGL